MAPHLLLAMPGALAIGISLGLLGSGGSILTVPVLHYLLGQPEKVAIGGSLLVVGLIALAACIPYARRRQLDWPNVLWFGGPGMAGAWAGASLATIVPGALQMALFAAVMLLAAWRMLTASALEPERALPQRWAVVAGGTAVGLLSGLVGVGGGFLIVPALVLLAGVGMANAVGTSLAIISMNAFAGFARYVGVLQDQELQLNWPLLLIVAAVGIAGSLLGGRLGRKLPQRTLRRLFGIFLLLMGAFIALDSVPAVLQKLGHLSTN
jgi:uncharacterized membrane protein YfcA